MTPTKSIVSASMQFFLSVDTSGKAFTGSIGNNLGTGRVGRRYSTAASRAALVRSRGLPRRSIGRTAPHRLRRNLGFRTALHRLRCLLRFIALRKIAVTVARTLIRLRRAGKGRLLCSVETILCSSFFVKLAPLVVVPLYVLVGEVVVERTAVVIVSTASTQVLTVFRHVLFRAPIGVAMFVGKIEAAATNSKRNACAMK